MYRSNVLYSYSCNISILTVVLQLYSTFAPAADSTKSGQLSDGVHALEAGRTLSVAQLRHRSGARARAALDSKRRRVRAVLRFRVAPRLLVLSAGSADAFVHELLAAERVADPAHAIIE